MHGQQNIKIIPSFNFWLNELQIIPGGSPFLVSTLIFTFLTVSRVILLVTIF